MASAAKPAAADRFKPIYDAIRERDIGRAVKLCDRKEIAQTAKAKALKALALAEGGYYNDARPLALEAIAPWRGAPATDAAALVTAAKVLFRTGETAEVIRAYEDAVAAVPDSESLLRGLCLACARAEDWKKLQTSALKLYGKHPKPLYMCWAALALHVTAGQPAPPAPGTLAALAGVQESEKPAPNAVTGGGRALGASRLSGTAAMPLVLAERSLAKALDACTSPDQRDADTLGLYLHSLVRQGKPGEAFAALMGKYAYLPPADAAAGALSPTASAEGGAAGEEGGALTAEQLQAEQDEEDAEINAEATGEDMGAPSVLPDGRGGRGKVPGPLQPEDQLRLAAQLLSWRAAWGPAPGEAVPLPVPAPANPAWVVCDPTGGNAVGTWAAAKHAFGALLEKIEASRGEWDVHCGLAYSWAREACEALGSGAVVDAGKVASMLAPVLKADGSGIKGSISGVAGADAVLVAHGPSAGHLQGTEAASAGPASPAADAGSDAGLNTLRACYEAAILHQAVRCEIAHRLANATGPAAPTAEVAAAAGKALAEGTAAYTQLVAAFVRLLGAKPAVFSDLRPFLVPFARPAAGSAGATAGAGPEAGAAAGALAGFLSAEPSILPTSFNPQGQPGSAAETAPSRSLFAWSFTVPTATTGAHLLPLLMTMRDACRPDESLSSGVKKVLAEGRAAAVAAGLVDKDDVMVRTRDIRGGGRDKAAGGAATNKPYNPRNPPEADPHGVAWALSARDEFIFTEEHKAVLASARAKIRGYSTAMSLLRYLGVADLQGCALAEAGAGPALPPHAPSAATAAPAGTVPGRAAPVPGEAGLRAVAHELTCAWEHTLHLLAASPAEGKDQGEGDELLLLAVHCLWDLATAHMLARENVAAVPGPTNAGPGVHAAASESDEGARAHLYASRAYLFEATALLHAGVSHSAHNAQLRLALVRCFSWLAAPSAVLAHAALARIRYISQETLAHASYMAFYRAYWPIALDVDKQNFSQAMLTRFLLEAQGSRPEFVRTALRAGNVASAADLIRAKPRLHHSASGAWARAVNLAFVTYDRAGKPLPEVRQVLYPGVMEATSGLLYTTSSADALAALRDNEDREATVNWAQPSGLSLVEARAGTLAAIAKLGASSSVLTTQALIEAGVAMITAGAGTSETGPVLAWTHRELASWAVGSAGGAAERLLRRACREVMISARAEISKALLFGMHLLSADGTPAQAKVALDKLSKVLALAGVTVPGAAAWSAATAPDAATVAACSTVAGTLAASQAEGGSGAALRLALFGDWTSGALPIVDTGLSTERAGVRVAAAVALWRALAGLVGLADAAVTTGQAPAAQAAAVTAAAANLRLACTLGADVITTLASTLYEAPPLASDGAGAPGSSPSSAAAPVPAATTALGGPATIHPPQPVIAGVPSVAPGGGAMRPGWAVEAPLALHHMLAPLTIALAASARHLTTLAGGDKAGKDKKEKKGKDKGGEEKKEEGGAAGGEGAIVVAALPTAVTSAQASVKEGAAALVESLNTLKASVKACFELLKAPAMETAMKMLTGGWDISTAATGTVRGMRPVLPSDEAGSKGKGGKDKGAKGGAATAAAGGAAGGEDKGEGDGPAPTEPGALFIHTLSKQYRKGLRVEGVEELLTKYGGAVMLTVQGVMEDAIPTRTAALKALAK